MTAQTTGRYRCNACGMIFNSMSDLDAHTREKHRSTDEINTKTIYKNELNLFYIPPNPPLIALSLNFEVFLSEPSGRKKKDRYGKK